MSNTPNLTQESSHSIWVELSWLNNIFNLALEQVEDYLLSVMKFDF